MRSIFVIGTLLHLQMTAFCDYSVDHSSEALYSQIGLQNIQKAYKRHTVYAYPTAETDYNFEIVNQPSQSGLWKNYFVPLVNENSYIRPIKTNCEAELIYQKGILNEPDCYQSSSRVSNSWAPFVNPVVIRPAPGAKAEIEVVKVEKSALGDALKLANMLYRNEPISYTDSTSGSNKNGNDWKSKKYEEVVVSVNLGCKNNQTGKIGVVNQEQSIDNNKVNQVAQPVKCEKVPPKQTPLNPQLDPAHLLKSGKIQLKETHLSEHDSIVEVILGKSDSCNGQPADQEPCESKSEPRPLPQGGEDCDGEETTSQPCQDGANKEGDRPIIKNRFVVLHLKDGERMIQDPLIKFLTKV